MHIERKWHMENKTITITPFKGSKYVIKAASMAAWHKFQEDNKNVYIRVLNVPDEQTFEYQPCGYVGPETPIEEYLKIGRI